MHTLHVELPAGSYPIMIEPGLVPMLGGIVAALGDLDRVALVVDSAIIETHGRAAIDSLKASAIDPVVVTINADETNKVISTVTSIHDAMLAARLERRHPVLALGGGIVGDVAGFAAATYLRGVPVVQIPTTVLAMVDAAIGGKTGVNHPLPSGQLGKNLIGAFWQPRTVVVDPMVLDTLDERDYRCGLAECVKHGVIADVELLTFLADSAEAIDVRDTDVLAELVRRAAKVKVAIVQQDEREAGIRALLNLGHTFGHAMETIPELDLRHGEAVAIGLCAAVECAVLTDRMERDEAQSIVDLLELLDLPVAMRVAVDVGRLMDTMRYDKKVSGGALRLILPVGLGQAEIADDVPSEAIAAGWNAVTASV